MAYGAAVWHTPTLSGGKPKGVVKSLQTTQNKCLRVISGAYRSTETRLLESEVWCPPLDLYLNRWVARFEERLEKTRDGSAHTTFLCIRSQESETAKGATNRKGATANSRAQKGGVGQRMARRNRGCRDG